MSGKAEKYDGHFTYGTEPKHAFDRIPCVPQNLPVCYGKDKNFLAYQETTPGHLTCSQSLTELSYFQSCISFKTIMRVCPCLYL